MKTKLTLVLMLVMFVAGASAATAVKKPLSGEELEEKVAQIRAEYARLHYTAQCNIVDYVHDKLGWKDGEYRIRYSHENAEGIYFILWNVSVEETLVDPETQTILNVPGDYKFKIERKTNDIVWAKEQQ